MCLFVANRIIKRPPRILYDVLVRMEKFIFPLDFVILDCEVDEDVPIVLCRIFLDISKALVDVESGDLKFRVND